MNNDYKWKASIELKPLNSHLEFEYKRLETINESIIKSIDNVEESILALQKDEETRFFSVIGENQNIDLENKLFLKNYNDEILLRLTDQTVRKDVIVDILDEISILNKSDYNSLDQYYDQLEYQATNLKTIPPIMTPENKQIFKKMIK